jgi:probable addiction module antidote protein
MARRSVRATHNQHLRIPEVATDYLNEAISSGDKSVLLMALRNVAEAQEDGITGLASRSELGRESMYKMLSSAGNPKLETFMKVMHGLGLRIRIEQEKHNNNDNRSAVA